MGCGADARKSVKKQEEEEERQISSSSRNAKKPRTTYHSLAYAGTERVAPTTRKGPHIGQHIKLTQQSSPLMRTPERCPISYDHQDTDTASDMHGSTADLLNGIRSHWSGYLPLIGDPFHEEVLQSQYEQGKHKIAQSWSNRIPQFVLAYLQWTERTKYGREEQWPFMDCSCMGVIIQLKCYQFSMSPYPNNSAAQVDEFPFTSGAEMIQVHYCTTKPLTEKLVEMGYFPSSPVQPQIALNLSLMNFSSFMFIHTIPNITGFIETIVAHLTLRKYKIPSAVSYYHPFSSIYCPTNLR